MRLHLAGLMAALLLVTACETTPEGGAGSASGSGSTMGAGGTSSITGQALRNPNAKPGSVEDFIDNVGDHVYYGFDSAELTPEDQATLDAQAAWLKQYGSVNVVIEGHCDERGTREYNLALGQKRADAAKSYLVAAGVDASRLETISYGKERPEVTGSNEEAWAKNRRAVTVIK